MAQAKAISDEKHFHAMEGSRIAAAMGIGVVSGGAVTASAGTMNTSVAVAVVFDGSIQAVSGADVTHGTANATNPRRDLVIWDQSAGALAVVAGTAAAITNPTLSTPSSETTPRLMTSPALPDIGADDDVLLAEVYIPAGETNSSNFTITDRRAFIANAPVNDAVDLAWGASADAVMRWSTGDASNHAFVIGVGNTSQQIHITDAGAVATDWARSAGTHPELAIHSNTTPITDYMAIGNHDGTTAYIDVVGGTTLQFKIAGNAEASITASGLVLPANSDLNFTGTTGTNDIVLVNGLADALSITDGSADVAVINTSTAGNVMTFTAAFTISGAVSVDDTTDSTSGTTGSIHTDGGIGVAKDIAGASDLLLVTSGATINFNAGDVVLTHSSNTLTMTGGSFVSTLGATTLAGAVAGGDQAFTGVGDMTFTDGSILAAVDGAGTTLLLKSGGLSGTTFITLTSQSSGTDTMILGKSFFYDAGGEYIESDGTDLTIASGNEILLSAGADVVLPVNVGLHFGDGAEKIESDNTDLTINSGGEILLTAASDVVLPVNIGLHFGDGAEKIESDNTDMTINSGGAINLTASTDIVIPANIGITFGTGEKIEGNDTNLTITSGAGVIVTATTFSDGTATLTSGEWDSGTTLNACVGKGTWTASGTWTLPAWTAGGAINFNSQNMTNVDIDSGTISSVTLDGTVTTNNQNFDAGSGDFNIVTTAEWRGLKLQNTHDGAGAFRLFAYVNSASPAGGDSLLSVMGKGKTEHPALNDVEYSEIRLQIEDATDGSHAGKMEFHNHLSGSDNTAMTLSGAGALGADGAFSEFDDYDDFSLMCVKENDFSALCDAGVMSRKDTGSGYMLNIQNGIYLGWGGVKQNRNRIDNLIGVIVDEFPQVADRLEERGLLIS